MPNQAETFYSSQPNLISSSLGFAVEFQMPSRLLYREGDLSRTIFAERLVRPEPTLIVREGDVGKAGADTERIIGNIDRAFHSQGWRILIERT